MKEMDVCQGGFTLPGEAGYEQLTLELAKKWGADVIRDSDGTKLSSEITDAGYRIYSTVCIIREHNAFAAEHPDAQQQTFLMSDPVTADSDILVICLRRSPIIRYMTGLRAGKFLAISGLMKTAA